MPSTLVVHQDKKTLHYIADALTSLDIDILLSQSVLSMFRLLWTHAPKILLLSDNLPGVDSLELCRQLRRDQKLSGLLIMLLKNGNSSNGDQVAQALNAGADDCMNIGEIDATEFVARVRALARRSQLANNTPPPHTHTEIQLRLHMLPHLQSVQVGARTIQLTQIEYRLLDHLVKAGGSVVPTPTLQKAIWGPSANIHDTNLVRVHIRNLRKKIERDPSQPLHIRTLRGVGYYLDASPSGGGVPERPLAGEQGVSKVYSG